MHNGQYPFNTWQAQAAFSGNRNLVAGFAAINQLHRRAEQIQQFVSQRYVQSSSQAKPSSSNSIDYNPDPQLPSYVGPYPVRDLQRARETLIYSLKHENSDILQRVKPRLGINSCYGEAYKFVPPKLPAETITAKSDQTVTQAKSVALTNNSSMSKPTAALQALVQSAPSTQSPVTVASNSQQQSLKSTQSSSASVPISDTSQNKGGATNPQSRIENFTITQSNLASDKATPNASSVHSMASNMWDSIVEKTDRKRKSNFGNPDETPSKRAHSEHQDDKSREKLIYKCDFCNTQEVSKDDITSHLQQAKHFSASLYTTSDTKLVAVEKKLAVRQKNMKNAALVVVCPECHDLFEDIFMCGMHYKYSHGGHSNHGFYAITPVIHVENVVVYSQPRCQKCNVDFNKHRLLHRHWESDSSHHPLTKNVPEKAFAIFSCLYCNKTFYGDFYGCKSHVVNHKDQKGQLRVSCAMKVTHILKPLRKEELLPLSKSSILDGMDDELNILRNMKKHFQGMNGTKQKQDLITRRIAFLMQFKDANVTKDSIL